MISIRRLAAAIAAIFLLNSHSNAQTVHEAAKASAAANIAVIGNQPSPALAAACERHVLQNQLGASIRASWKRSAPFDSKYAFFTPQVMTHRGQGDLGKKLVPYYTKFSGTNALGLPGTITAVCFFRVEGGKARFETSCKTGGSCPFYFHVPPWDY